MTAVARLAVIWIDWYAYHIARFRALAEHDAFRGRATGIELVGGVGVHAGLPFRDHARSDLPITTLLAEASWSSTTQRRLAQLLWQRLNQLKPSVLLVPGYYTLPAVAAAVWGKFHGARTILMSESTEADHVRTPLRERLKGILIRALFDYAVVGGERHREYLVRLGFDDNRIGLRYDVVDNRFFADGARDLRASGRPVGFEAPARYFLFVGRLAEEKNVDLLLRSYAAYVQEGGRWDVVVAGDGPARAALMSLANELNVLARVVFVGHKTTAELVGYYAFASAFVLPSRREPWGLVVNEAMAAGLPVVVSRVCGAVGDIVAEGENGFTFSPRSPEQLTALLQQISDSSEEALRAMSQRSTEIIEEYSPVRWAAEVARLAGL